MESWFKPTSQTYVDPQNLGQWKVELNLELQPKKASNLVVKWRDPKIMVYIGLLESRLVTGEDFITYPKQPGVFVHCSSWDNSYSTSLEQIISSNQNTRTLCEPYSLGRYKRTHAHTHLYTKTNSSARKIMVTERSSFSYWMRQIV